MLTLLEKNPHHLRRESYKTYRAVPLDRSYGGGDVAGGALYPPPRSAISDILVAYWKEARHAAKSHRDRRRIKGELRQSRRECRCRSRKDGAQYEVGAGRGIRDGA